MSRTIKFAAASLFLLAGLLGYLAYRVATRPAPPPPPVARKEPPAPRATYPVVVAAKAIAAGDRLDPDDLKVEQWPMQPQQSYARVAPLAERYARMDIGPGQPVTESLLSQGLSRYLEVGERAVTIPVDEIAGVQNRVLPGDRVDLFYVLERGSEVGGTQTRLLQSRVKVLAYGMRSVDGPPPGIEEKPAAGPPQRGAAAAPRNAVLAVPVERVNELLLAAKSGKLQMALRAPDDDAVPDPSLFPARTPVLAVRPGLTPDQQAQATHAVNLAYAGEGLQQLAGPPPAPEVRPRPRPSAPGAGRSIEVVRGADVQTVRY